MKLSELFDVKYGVNLELNKLEAVSDSSGINFVARTCNNNGVVCRVTPIGISPNPAGTLSCAAGGSTLSTFVQRESYYSGRDLYVLKPKYDMSLVEKFYYAHLISSNKYKYSYGRQANKTLKDIELPDSVPSWLSSFTLQPFQKMIRTKNTGEARPVDTSKWKEFNMGDVFTFSKGKRLTKLDMVNGKLNYIGAVSGNNGIRQSIDANPTHKGNCITVNYNGSVGEAFYQKDDFWASDDVNVLHLKERVLTRNIGLFLCTIIKTNKYKFGYGRKWTLEKMKESTLLLPVNESGLIDWDFMETYIKSSPYADCI
jgi:hypothetical protein